jgi:hypothetical protein
MTMTPTIGRIVHLFPGIHATHLHTNGNGPNDPIAAVIVRVWNDDLVNLMALVDGPAPIWVTSVNRHAPDNMMRWDWPQIVPNVVPTAKAL